MVIVIAPWALAVIGLLVYALSPKWKWVGFALFCIGLFFAVQGLPNAFK